MTPAFGAVVGYAVAVWSTIILEGVYLLANEGREAEAEEAKKDAAPATGKKKKSGAKVIDKRSK